MSRPLQGGRDGLRLARDIDVSSLDKLASMGQQQETWTKDARVQERFRVGPSLLVLDWGHDGQAVENLACNKPNLLRLEGDKSRLKRHVGRPCDQDFPRIDGMYKRGKVRDRLHDPADSYQKRCMNAL